MRRQLADYSIFLKEFRRTFRTTGAVLPSGRALANALASQIGRAAGGLRILEVGPGTGAVTAAILRRLAPGDRLDLVELNDQFVSRLQQRFAEDPAFRPFANRTRVLHQGIEESLGATPYDVIVSGLPLNNFAVAEVEQILARLVALLRPGGHLSFFEYIAIRRVKAVCSRASERERLRGIGRALDALFAAHTARRQRVWINVPPAWVHHLQIAGGS